MKWIGLTLMTLLITLSHAQGQSDQEEDHEIYNDVSVVGWNSAARKSADAVGYSFIFPGKPIPWDGVVSQWMFWAKVSQPLRAVVWRPTNLDTVYTVVGINDIPAGNINEAVVYTVPKNQRIEVHQGDVIGVSFSEASPQITWEGVGPDAAQTRWYRDSDASDLNVGDTAITTGVADRSFSFSAIVSGASPGQSLRYQEVHDVLNDVLHDVLAQGKVLLEFLTKFPDLE